MCKTSSHPKNANISSDTPAITNFNPEALQNRGALDLSRQCKLLDNGYVEAFNARQGRNRLAAVKFMTLPDASDRLMGWRIGQNEHRPHTSLGCLTLGEFTQQAQRQTRLEWRGFPRGNVSCERGEQCQTICMTPACIARQDQCRG
jgi:hypothetical protein